MNRSQLISATAAAFLTAVFCLANAQPVATSTAALSATAASPKPAMRPVSDTIDAAAAPQPVYESLLDTPTTRSMERIAPRPANTMAG